MDPAGRSRRAQTWIGPSFLAVGAHGPTFEPTYLVAGCFGAALLAAFAESLRTGIDDNLLVPAVGGAALFAATLVDPARLADLSPVLARDAGIGAAVNGVLAVAAYAARGVDRSGALCGWCLGVALYHVLGLARLLAPVAFFSSSGRRARRSAMPRRRSSASRKSRADDAAPRTRSPTPPLACSSRSSPSRPPHPTLFALALVAAFATAAADTVSSEIGQAFGRTAYLVTSFKRVPAGTEGAVSLEGTLAGFGASTVPAAFAAAASLITWPGAAIVVAAALRRHHARELPRRNPPTHERHRQRGRELCQHACRGLAAMH